MNTYAVTYVEIDATQTTSQTIKTDMVSAADYEVGNDFVNFIDVGHQVVAAYAVKRVVSITTTPASSG